MMVKSINILAIFIMSSFVGNIYAPIDERFIPCKDIQSCKAEMVSVGLMVKNEETGRYGNASGWRDQVKDLG
ncbi:unnamed protein product [Macrosiphum euphorbiae]|uniref:Lysozyme n=1 Tax=Macrosiphum euphorbiae TaxID=13131 RepID=A0AAV0X594_9HEMI|nr:unnamed protein product [Macrosiphum euphorbiae]